METPARAAGAMAWHQAQSALQISRSGQFADDEPPPSIDAGKFDQVIDFMLAGRVARKPPFSQPSGATVQSRYAGWRLLLWGAQMALYRGQGWQHADQLLEV
jgi:hypothetical protein